MIEVKCVLMKVPDFKTAGQRLFDQIKTMRKHRRSGKHFSTKRIKGRKLRGRSRQQRGHGHKRGSNGAGAKRLYGDEPQFPPTDYISKRAFQLRKDIYNGYK